MKHLKRISALLFYLLFITSLKAQTAQDLFSPSDYEFTWLGIDYSQVKIIGDFSQFNGAGSSGPSEIKNKYFPAWNALVLNEPDKYKIKDAFRKSTIQYDIDMVTARNAKTKLETMEGTSNPNYSTEKIEEIVKSYPLKGKKGFGVVFIAETLNKTSEEAYFHVVVLNLETKQVLIQQKMRGVPGGIGLRNYWARPIYDIIKEIESRQYKVWKSTYAKH